MTSEEKKLLQAKHGLEEAQARDRVKDEKPGQGGSFRRVLCWKKYRRKYRR